MKNTTRTTACRSALRLLGETTGILIPDLRADLRDLDRDLQEAGKGNTQGDNFESHLKSAIRSLFGLAEAINNAVAPAIIDSSHSGGMSLSKSDRAVLLECDHDPASDRCIEKVPRRHPLAQRLQITFRLFTVACGTRPLPDWDPIILSHFKKLTWFRNRLTHPKRLEQLIALPAFESFRHVAIWFTAETIRLLAKAGQGLGIPTPVTPVENVVIDPFPYAIPRPEEIFNDEFYNQVFSTPSAAIGYIRLFSDRLHQEVTFAFSSSHHALSQPDQPQLIGRSARQMIRAVQRTALYIQTTALYDED